MRKFFRGYWISLVVLTLGLLAKSALTESSDIHLYRALTLGAIGLVLGLVTLGLSKAPIPRPARTVLVVVAAYHALFAPIMLAYLILTESTRNDDLPLRLYPHVIEFINSFE